MFHVENFWFCPDEDFNSKGTSFEEALLVWIQSEMQDEAGRTSVLRKMVKNIRWLAKKLETTRVVLHSFAHLGESKSASEFADKIIEETATRLRDREFEVHIVPFGAFHEFKMHVKGPSLAKVFKSF
jgi:biotin synthase-related radical SAM superfamily protein